MSGWHHASTSAGRRAVLGAIGPVPGCVGAVLGGGRGPRASSELRNPIRPATSALAAGASMSTARCACRPLRSSPSRELSAVPSTDRWEWGALDADAAAAVLGDACGGAPCRSAVLGDGCGGAPSAAPVSPAESQRMTVSTITWSTNPIFAFVCCSTQADTAPWSQPYSPVGARGGGSSVGGRQSAVPSASPIMSQRAVLSGSVAAAAAGKSSASSWWGCSNACAVCGSSRCSTIQSSRKKLSRGGEGRGARRGEHAVACAPW